jgi:hypothetical protein
MTLRFGSLALSVQGSGQIAADTGLGAGEAVIHGVECSGELVSGFGVTEVDEAVAAPAGQVDRVQREMWTGFSAR